MLYLLGKSYFTILKRLSVPKSKE